MSARKKRATKKPAPEYFFADEYVKPTDRPAPWLPTFGELMAMSKTELIGKIVEAQRNADQVAKERDRYLDALQQRQVVINSIWKYLNGVRYSGALS